MTTTHGRCLCGAIRYVYDPDGVLWRGHCHCDSCRRATGSPMTTFFGVRDGAFRWLRGRPKVYESSPGVRRGFCAGCGTPLTYQADRYPGETHFYAATLVDPADFTPEAHFHRDEQLPWMKLADDLPNVAASPAVKGD